MLLRQKPNSGEKSMSFRQLFHSRKPLLVGLLILLSASTFLVFFVQIRFSGKHHHAKNSAQKQQNNYLAEEAFLQRAQLLNQTCKLYAEKEALMIAGKGPMITNNILEKRRMFLLNHGLSVCIPDIEYSDLLTILFQQIFEDRSESDLSLLDPCKAKAMRQKADLLSAPRQANQGSNSHVVFNNPLRRLADSASCNLAKEIEEHLPLSITVVHHPMERIALEAAATADQSESSRNSLETSNQSESFIQKLLQNSIHLKPYWQQCHLCSPGFSPNLILKHEYLNLDLIHLIGNVLRFNSSLRDLPEKFFELQPVGVSQGARKFWSEQKKTVIRDVFELFKMDHELFGYDPRPYIDLGID